MPTSMPASVTVDTAIILVGGWGTRLRPLTASVPKPLIPFCNRPMLQYQIEKLSRAGVRRVVLALNYYSQQIIDHCRSYERLYGIEIVYSREDVPLGTGGPLSLAADHLRGSPFFVMNSDICCDVDLSLLRDRFLQYDCEAIILTYPVPGDPTRYGLIQHQSERIVSFVEKPTDKNEIHGPGPWIINAGVYIFADSVLGMLRTAPLSLEEEIFPRLAARGSLCHAVHGGYWMDIGQIREYLVGQRLFLNSREGAEHGMGEGSGKCAGYLSPSVDGERNVVVGRGVSIGEGVDLENCAIFDGAAIGSGSVIRDSIIGWDCTVGRDCLIGGFSALGRGVAVADGTALSGERVEGEAGEAGEK